MKRLMLCILASLSLCGCASFSGGADYYYHIVNPQTNKETTVKVHSNRKLLGPTSVHFSPDGNVTVNMNKVIPGANNMGTALQVINNLSKVAAGIATKP